MGMLRKRAYDGQFKQKNQKIADQKQWASRQSRFTMVQSMKKYYLFKVFCPKGCPENKKKKTGSRQKVPSFLKWVLQKNWPPFFFFLPRVLTHLPNWTNAKSIVNTKK